ncbi:MAG TPA: M12 family metallopeptidase, partial [Thermoanaerobaculia bacterium]|nr:M12 family metallopeptidase [Thermoanaerobaculia bacterium]
WDKILPGFQHNFDQHINDGDDVGAYDYGSIMHYPRDAFSTDGSDTITPTQAGAQIGQRIALSAGDIAAAATLCPAPVKSPFKDFVTKKEQIKDIKLDTKKELVTDTKKEIIFDTKKEIVETLKEGSSDPIKTSDSLNPSPFTTLPATRTSFGGSLPFAVATPHQAPGAMGNQDTADMIGQLDGQLQALADALAEAEAHRQMLQQQYDETAALLKQVLDAGDQ